MLKDLNDYYDKFYELYPDVSKSDIKKIMTYGCRVLYMLNSSGCDVLLKGNNNFWLYFGTLFYNSLQCYIYYKRKLAKKIRIKAIRAKEPYDGYYYFALTEHLYLAYINLISKNRKWYTFNNVLLFKIKNECLAFEANKKYIFRVKMPVPITYRIFKHEFKTKYSELYFEREHPLTLKELINFKNTLWQTKSHKIVSQEDLSRI